MEIMTIKKTTQTVNFHQQFPENHNKNLSLKFN